MAVKDFLLGRSKMHIVKEQRTIIADTGFFTTKESYQQLFENEKINPEDVSLIVITHGHWDHFAGADDLRDVTGAPILCHKLAADALINGDPLKYPPRNADAESFIAEMPSKTRDLRSGIVPDILIDDVFDLIPYGVHGKIVPTPGHSDCSLSVVLDSGEALIGDLVQPSPFTGELIISLITPDESVLRASLSSLLEQANVFYAGHSGPYTAEEIKQTLN